MRILVKDIAATLADSSTVHNSMAFDVSIRLFRLSDSLDLLVRCRVLDHLSSDLVSGMDWL